MSLVVIPIFALANTSVSIDFSSACETLLQPISSRIIIWLIFGKDRNFSGISTCRITWFYLA
ncbi:Na+/H+ antiporter NhaA [Sulfurimonas sp.]|uniref:Na+/H+ antiporter NhaA n=1 Tax=Sulfurimonas sp. TaxID=2022749 RepID=UPI0025DB3DA8|nr:Na+/H+ antiporter NhaA [Sulfurimonas sp.]MDD5156854.1 Na+/H+ antiporter NhaA [Sulfurimonas sp.]